MSTPTPDSWSSDPALWIVTSLTAGSSHIVTATSRLETILRANRIPFKAVDVAVEDKARVLWGRRAGKDPSGRLRKFPGLVQDGMVIGDLVEIEEWNEYGELKQHVKIYYDDHTIPPLKLLRRAQPRSRQRPRPRPLLLRSPLPRTPPPRMLLLLLPRPRTSQSLLLPSPLSRLKRRSLLLMRLRPPPPRRRHPPTRRTPPRNPPPPPTPAPIPNTMTSPGPSPIVSPRANPAGREEKTMSKTTRRLRLRPKR
jgi:hypothetical protein